MYLDDDDDVDDKAVSHAVKDVMVQAEQGHMKCSEKITRH